MYSHLFSWAVLVALTAYSPLTSDNRRSPQTASALGDLGYAQYQGTHLTVGVNQDRSVRCAGTSSVRSPLRLICCNLSDKSCSGDSRWRAPADPLLTKGIQHALKIFLHKTLKLPSFSMSCAFLTPLEPLSFTKGCLFKI
jgi:hypothetical protein